MRYQALKRTDTITPTQPIFEWHHEILLANFHVLYQSFLFQGRYLIEPL